MPARVRGKRGLNYISMNFDVEPICNGCKARKTQEEEKCRETFINPQLPSVAYNYTGCIALFYHEMYVYYL